MPAIELAPRYLHRFWSYVDIAGPDECWLWRACTLASGYGQFRAGPQKFRAHRLSFGLANDSMPECVCHSCDNPRCVNPRHLWPGTNADNSRDAMQKRRHPHGERHGRAKLTPAMVIEIRSSGEPDTRIALRLGVSSATVRYARIGATWRDVVAA